MLNCVAVAVLLRAHAQGTRMVKLVTKVRLYTPTVPCASGGRGQPDHCRLEDTLHGAISTATESMPSFEVFSAIALYAAARKNSLGLHKSIGTCIAECHACVDAVGLAESMQGHVIDELPCSGGGCCLRYFTRPPNSDAGFVSCRALQPCSALASISWKLRVCLLQDSESP